MAANMRLVKSAFRYGETSSSDSLRSIGLYVSVKVMAEKTLKLIKTLRLMTLEFLASARYFFDRNERSTVSCGSSEIGWSRHNHRIISGSIAPPMLWLCTPIPHE
jgi:hypothetical protein